MPLHRGHVTGPCVPDRLDHAVVWAVRLDHEARRQVFDSLVVNTVDFEARTARQQLAKPGFWHHAHGVEILVVDLGVAVFQCLRPLRRDVLVQRAAKRHID